MNSKLIRGDEKPEAEALEQMRRGAKIYPGSRYAAYQNHDLGHRELGHLKFMCVGPENSFKEAPDRLPDTNREINWRYVHVGFVNLETGEITAT